MIPSIPSDLPLLYDKNRRTFILILSFLIGLLYLAVITSNGLQGFVDSWTSNPEHEHYVLIPYRESTEELKADTKKIEGFLKESTLIKGFRRVDEESFQKLFNPQVNSTKSWIETIPFPVFIELNMNSRNRDAVDKMEKELKQIVPYVQIYAQPRYSSEFMASFSVLNYILNFVIACLAIAFFAVMVLMTRAHFAQQEKNIERLSLLGATPSYIKKLYCWFMARCIALSAFYGFLGGFSACWIIHLATQNMAFFPYGFSAPSVILYLVLPHLCLFIGVGVTYILTSELIKKSWTCA